MRYLIIAVDIDSDRHPNPDDGYECYEGDDTVAVYASQHPNTQ